MITLTLLCVLLSHTISIMLNILGGTNYSSSDRWAAERIYIYTSVGPIHINGWWFVDLDLDLDQDLDLSWTLIQI